MCGLSCCIGQNAVIRTLNYLKDMQYRGYDSYGIAYYEHGRLQVKKFLGAIKENTDFNFISELAIGHTRWATHGSVDLKNTHPLLYNDLAIVHNGIIENHLEIKRNISNFPWSTDTDTEVILALLSQSEVSLGLVQETVNILAGSFTFVAVTGQKVYFARKGVTPLYIKIGSSIDIASDVSTIHGSDEIILVEDGQIGMISGLKIITTPEKVTYINNRTEERISEKKYNSWFEEEFFSQPIKLSKAIKNQVEFPDLQGSTYITGCGSAYLAGLVGSYWLEKVGLQISVRYPSELPERLNSLILVSQSGETADILKVMNKTKSTVAIVNNEYSSIALRASKVLPIFMDKEISVASTKATVGQMLTLLRWATHLGLAVDLDGLPSIIQNFIDNRIQNITLIAEICSKSKNLFIIGRGILYPIALEAALKIKELTYIHAEGMCSAELKHGPLALIDENSLVICLTPKNEDTVSEVRARKGQTIVFTPKPELFPESIIFEMPEVDELLLPFLYILPMQWLAYSIAKILGNSIDLPRNLAKSVTVS